MAIEVEQLFTPVNIASLGVATVAVTVVTNTFYALFKAPPKWTAFIVALTIMFAIVAMQPKSQWYDWLFGFFNACLLFCSALGVTELGDAKLTPKGKAAIATKPFLRSWLR